MPNTNTLTNVVPQILAQGLITLRENTVMPLLVNSDYSNEAKQHGSAVDIPIPSAIAVNAVTPSYVAPDTTGVTPTKTTITLDKWYEAPFFLTDKDILDAMKGIIPMQAKEAVKALANQVDQDLLLLYKNVWNTAGVAGTTPFALDTKDATDVRVKLGQNLAPLNDRSIVLDPVAEGNALNLRAFTDYSFQGSLDEIRNGKITPKLGFVFAMDQNIRTHTVGTLGGTGADPTKVNASAALGATTVVFDVGATNNMALLAGDVVQFAGDANHYVVEANTAGTAGSTANVTITPGLKVALDGAETITLIGSDVGSYTVNMGFHRDAFAFASRPLMDSADGLGNIIMSMVDPVSRLTLRLEVSREHKRTRFSYDILYGVKAVRPALAVRLMG